MSVGWWSLHKQINPVANYINIKRSKQICLYHRARSSTAHATRQASHACYDGDINSSTKTHLRFSNGGGGGFWTRLHCLLLLGYTFMIAADIKTGTQEEAGCAIIALTFLRSQKQACGRRCQLEIWQQRNRYPFGRGVVSVRYSLHFSGGFAPFIVFS